MRTIPREETCFLQGSPLIFVALCFALSLGWDSVSIDTSVSASQSDMAEGWGRELKTDRVPPSLPIHEDTEYVPVCRDLHQSVTIAVGNNPWHWPRAIVTERSETHPKWNLGIPSIPHSAGRDGELIP